MADDEDPGSLLAGLGNRDIGYFMEGGGIMLGALSPPFGPKYGGAKGLSSLDLRREGLLEWRRLGDLFLKLAGDAGERERFGLLLLLLLLLSSFGTTSRGADR